MRLFTKLLMSCLAIALATPSWSETLSARSGEHEGFSRIVLDIPRGTSWNLAQQNRSAQLVISIADVLIDTSKVFLRIPRTRLRSLQQIKAGAPLEFSLACDCKVSAFLQSDRYLVVDIEDPSPPSENARGQKYALPVLASVQPYRFGELNKSRDTPPKASGGHETRGTSSVSASDILASGLPAIATTNSVALVQMIPTEPDNTTDITRQRLFQQIGRASSLGLLNLRSVETEDQGVMQGSALLGDQMQLPHMSVTTTVDRDLAKVESTLANAGRSAKCLTGASLDIAKWASQAPLSQQLSELRSNLYGEFDRVNQDVALELARVYLHFGFGLEARTTLSLIKPPAPETELLLTMSMVFDNLRVPSPNPLTGQQHCDNEASLWSLLATGSPTQSMNTNAVQQAFARLPVHLRNYLGPILGRLLAKAGDEKTAASILRAVERSGEDRSVAVDMAHAALARESGDAETEIEHLETVVDSSSDHTPNAVIELVEAHLRDGTAVPPELPDLVAALATEYRKETTGPALRRARTLALASAGRFEEANESLQDINQRDGSIARNDARESTLALLKDRADDLVFLKFVIDETSSAPENVSAELGDALAERLLSLGFADEALKILVARTNAPTSKTRRLLRARAAIALNKPHRAMVELLGLNGQDSNRLRSTAMWMNGDFSQAGKLLLSTHNPVAAARSFWMSQDYNAVLETADPGYSAAAEGALTLASSDVATAEMTPLARARALIEDSIDTRDQITVLLSGLSKTELDSQSLLGPEAEE